MSHCDGSGSATVNFSFGDVEDSVLIEADLPINVEVTGSSQSPVWEVEGTFRGCPDDPRNLGSCWEITPATSPLNPGESGNNGERDGAFLWVFETPNTLVVEPSTHPNCPSCPTVRVRSGQGGSILVTNLARAEIRLLNCRLRVLGASGALLFERAGECPVRFSVGCDGDCPPGQCKCETLEFPGFCCCDCGGH